MNKILNLLDEIGKGNILIHQPFLSQNPEPEAEPIIDFNNMDKLSEGTSTNVKEFSKLTMDKLIETTKELRLMIPPNNILKLLIQIFSILKL